MTPLPLCPLSDFPYMLPECVPVGSILFFSSVAPIILVAVHLRWWQLHIRWWGGVRLKGHVARLGADGSAFVLHSKVQEPVLVDAGSAELRGWPARISEGCQVTVFGVPGSVRLREEQLYRDPHSRPGVEALRIVRHGWPALRWLTPLAVGGWLLFALALLWKCRWS